MKRRWFLSALLCAVLIGSMFSTSVFALEDIPTEPVSTEAESVPTEEPLTDDAAEPADIATPDDTAAPGDTVDDPEEADPPVDPGVLPEEDVAAETGSGVDAGEPNEPGDDPDTDKDAAAPVIVKAEENDAVTEPSSPSEDADPDLPDYTVTFDANVPARASTVCTGSMDDQSFAYDEEKPLSPNGYSLPGYDFVCWNTKADGTGTLYSDKSTAGSLSKDGGIVTLYAQWRAKPYTIYFFGIEYGGYHSQTAYFDQPGTLDKYSDAAFGWDSNGSNLLAWYTDDYAAYYNDGASFLNLCGEPLPDGSLADVSLTADWVDPGQIIAVVTLDNVAQEGFEDRFTLVDGDGTEFKVPTSWDRGKYVFDTSKARRPGVAEPGPLPEGEYELNFHVTTPWICGDSTKINYKADSASNAVFSYHPLNVKRDLPQDAGLWTTVDGTIGLSPAGWLVPDGSVATIRITDLSPGHILDRYTVDEGSPIYEDSDLTKAELPIQLLDKTTVTIHIIAKPTLTITPLPQKYTYSGQFQGEGDTVYRDPAEIDKKVSVEGLRDGDSIEYITLDGQGGNAGGYDLIADSVRVVNASGDDVTDNYNINCETGTLTIEPAKVTITVDSASKQEGTDDPTFTGTVDGLIDESDLGEIEFVRTGTEEAPGTYEGVLTATYMENPNYDVTVIPGDFTIESETPAPAEKATLTFDLGGGTLDGKTGTITIEANVGDTITLPGAPEKEGYRFLYWKGSRYEAGAEYTVTGPHDFTAEWEAVEEPPVEPDDPEPPVEPEEPDDTPATGDGSMPWMWAALMLTSLLTAVRLRKAR